jgi:hypothetical protein
MPIRLLLAATVLAAAAFGLRRLFGGYGATPAPGPVLSRRERAFVDAAAEAMFPAGGAIPPSGHEARVTAYVERYVERVPGRIRLLMRLLFLLVEQATILLPAPGRGGRSRFSSLPVEQRMAALEGWRTSRLFPRRIVFTSLRAILCMGYLADPAVLRHLGVAPYEIAPVVLEPDLLYPPVGRPRSAIRWTRADLTPPSAGVPIPLDAPLHPDYRASSA